MSEPGGGEIYSKAEGEKPNGDPIETRLRETRSAVDSGTLMPAHEALNAAALTVGKQIESRAIPPNLESAWTLERIVQEQIKGSVSYILRPPAEGPDISMAYVFVAPGMGAVAVLDSDSQTNPYDPSAPMQTRTMRPGSATPETLDLLADVYGSIRDQGVVGREGGVLLERRYDSERPFDIRDMPYSASIVPSSAAKLDEQKAGWRKSPDMSPTSVEESHPRVVAPAPERPTADAVWQRLAPVAQELLSEEGDPQAKISKGASAIGQLIEGADVPSSDSSDAFRLSRVRLEDGFGNATLTYLIEPPLSFRLHQGVQAVLIQDGGYKPTIKILLPNKIPPKMAGDIPSVSLHARDISRMKGESEEAFLRSVSRVVAEIGTHGIQKNPEEVIVTRDGTIPAAFLEKHPFSKDLLTSQSPPDSRMQRDVRRESASKESLIQRAIRLGLKGYLGKELKDDYGKDNEFLPGVADAITNGFEKQTLPEGNAKSYTLAAIKVGPIAEDSSLLDASYELVPPAHSILPSLEISGDNIYLIEDGERTLVDRYGTIPPETLTQILDVYEVIQSSGLRVPEDIQITLRLSTRPDGGSEALDRMRSHPRTLSMIDPELRARALAERDQQIAEGKIAAEREAAERRANWIRQTREREERSLGPFADLIRDEVNHLAGYTNTEGESVPGTLFVEADDALLATVGTGYSNLAQERTEGSHVFTWRMRNFLTTGLINLEGSERNRLLFSPPDNVSFERGTPPIEPDEMTDTFRSLRVERTDEEGNIPLAIDGEFTGMHIEPTPSDLHIDRVRVAGAEEGMDVHSSSELPESTEFDFKPTFAITLTEHGLHGEEETYQVWRVNEGILIQCANSDIPTFYPREVIQTGQAQVYRKPVIYLYPQKSTDVTVTLDYAGKLTNTYPHIDGDTWKVHAQPDSTLSVGKKKYKYLFWDGISDKGEWDWSTGFCVKSADVDQFLEDKMEQLGLNFAEAQDFITYWAPMLKQNEWTLVSFQTEKYEELAKLHIAPTPDTLIRVFMVFKKVDAKTDIAAPAIASIDRKGFTVVEWGGSNLDEISLSS